ncbi:unnamed protein product [Lampetra fluviatilis]
MLLYRRLPAHLAAIPAPPGARAVGGRDRSSRAAVEAPHVERHRRRRRRFRRLGATSEPTPVAASACLVPRCWFSERNWAQMRRAVFVACCHSVGRHRAMSHARGHCLRMAKPQQQPQPRAFLSAVCVAVKRRACPRCVVIALARPAVAAGGQERRPLPLRRRAISRATGAGARLQDRWSGLIAPVLPHVSRMSNGRFNHLLAPRPAPPRRLPLP